MLWNQQNRVDRVGHLSRYRGSTGLHYPIYYRQHILTLTMTMTMTITMILVDEYTSPLTALVRVRPDSSSSTM